MAGVGRLSSIYISAHTLILLSTACFTPSGCLMKQASKAQGCGKWCINKKGNTRVHKVARPKKASVSQYL